MSNNPIVLRCIEKKIEYQLPNIQVMEKILNQYNKYHQIGLIGNIKRLLFFVGVNICCTIIALSTLIANHKEYIELKEFLNTHIESTWYSLENYNTFWCNIGIYENRILFSYLAFIILLLLFNIITFLIHRNTINIKIGTGIKYNIIIIMTFLLHIIFFALVPFIFYLFVYSIIVVSFTPLDFEFYKIIYKLYNLDYDKILLNIPEYQNWKKKRAVPIVNDVFLGCLLYTLFQILYYINICIIYYLSLNFNDYNKKNKIINKNKRIKTKKICLNNHHLILNIKSEILFLFESKEENEQNEQTNFYNISGIEPFQSENKCLKFMKILIDNNISNNEYIYINLDNKSIENQLSLADWEYPDLNMGNNYLKYAFILNFIIILLSACFLKLHITNEASYDYLLDNYEKGNYKKPSIFNIMKIYPNFEKNVTNSRLICLLISQFFIIIFIIKRYIYGGFIYYKSIIISFILFIILFIINVIYSILLLIIIIFSILIFYEITMVQAQNIIVDTFVILENKLYLHIVLNSVSFGFYLVILFLFKKNYMFYIWKIIKDRKNLEKVNVLNSELIFDYIDLNNNNKRLREFRIKGLPKFLFFKEINEEIQEQKFSRNDIQIEMHNN